MNFTIIEFDSIDSTNSEAARQANSGAPEGLCIIARHQSAGRGRRGREWVSEKDRGLYFSIVLRPRLEPKHLPLITLMAGVAVHDLLEEYGVDADIKWVNDILIQDKKVSGILAEVVETPTGAAVVVGIGINLIIGDSPDVAHIATSIAAEADRHVSLEEAANDLMRHLDRWYDVLNANPRRMIEAWSERSTYFTGKQVRVTADGESFTGCTEGLEENGALRIRIPDGSIRIVQAGDVERLRPQENTD